MRPDLHFVTSWFNRLAEFLPPVNLGWRGHLKTSRARLFWLSAALPSPPIYLR
jgi:hypothetical protein